MSPWRIVFLKEVRENMRDRRTMFSTFVLGTLMGPILFAGLIGLIISVSLERAEKPLELPVVGAENAPSLIAWLKNQGVKIEEAPADPEAAIRKRDKDVVLRIPAEYGEQWRDGRAATLELIVDRSQQKAEQTIRRAERMLNAYNGQTASQRLIVRGISPEVVQPILIADVDQSTPQSRSGMLLAMLPYFLILTVFAGGNYLATDATAGERERQSLEPLLINPVSRGQIMSGKLIATFAFAVASLALSLVAFSLVTPLLPVEKIGMIVKMGPAECAMMFLIVAPLGLIGAGLLTSVSAFAKGFREAQTYNTLLIIMPAIPSMLMALNPVKPADWMYSVPLLSHQLLIEQTVRGESLVLWQVGLSIVSTLIVGVIIAAIAARLYHREHLAISA
ncbi:MAG: ABC transporter permease [Lysobacterales bacterium]|nr:ABC transporter permease [Xanthomonadales bacterium]MCP5473294.1 ABC transporter permease [Rhodanobacteraceae bacterium]